MEFLYSIQNNVARGGADGGRGITVSRLEVLGSGPPQINKGFHPFVVGELLSGFSAKETRLFASDCIGQIQFFASRIKG